MKFNVSHFDVIRRSSLVLRCKNSISGDYKAHFTTLSENKPNYYDILDKRNLTDSSGFETNDHRRSWTNRDDSTFEDHMDKYGQLKSSQNLVTTYRNCKLTNLRSKVNVAISSMDGDDLVSAICYNLFKIENDMSLESLYKHLEKYNMNALNKSIGPDKLSLLEDLNIQIEKLLYLRKLSMDQSVKILLLYERLDALSHQMRNLIQSHMLLNLHKFTPFQIVASFEVFGKHRERYENFLNLLCLIFYDHMIPLMRSNESFSSSVELSNVLDLLRVMKDFNFKKLTDVLYAHLYDNVERLGPDQMIQVSNTFFKHKRDPNFVELYTRLLSTVFRIPHLDLYNFETYVQNVLNHTDPNRNPDTTNSDSNILLDDINALKAIFNCNSEFLLSTIHHRIELKRLWRHNIKTNNVSWRLPTNSSEATADCENLPTNVDLKLLKNSENSTNTLSSSDHSNDLTASSNERLSYAMNFQNLYEKIENLILNRFKFQSHPRDFICNVIGVVLDYSRYFDSANARNILTNLYALLLSPKLSQQFSIEELELISPRTLLDHSHVYFYKIDDACEFYRLGGINYYKPHLTTYSLFGGDHTLYSLFLKVYTSYLQQLSEPLPKNDTLRLYGLISTVLHPFYCSARASTKPFLALDLLHMTGNLNNKSPRDFEQFAMECSQNVEKCLDNGLLGDLLSFTEQAIKYLSSTLDNEFTLNERIQLLRSISTINVCNSQLDQPVQVKQFLESSGNLATNSFYLVDALLEYFESEDKEDLEDGVRVGLDLKLFDAVADLLSLQGSPNLYELLRHTLKQIYSRMEYYSLEELISLSSCISSSRRHFSNRDLECDEALESLNQTVLILREQTVARFHQKSAHERDFNRETAQIYNVLMAYHLLNYLNCVLPRPPLK